MYVVTSDVLKSNTLRSTGTCTHKYNPRNSVGPFKVCPTHDLGIASNAVQHKPGSTIPLDVDASNRIGHQLRGNVIGYAIIHHLSQAGMDPES